MIVTFFTLSILIIDHLRDYGFKRDADDAHRARLLSSLVVSILFDFPKIAITFVLILSVYNIDIWFIFD